MKKLILSVVALLSGCSILLVAHYDSNEYGLVNKIRTQAELKNCTKDGVQTLYESALELKNYSQYLPYNDLTIKMNTDLFTLVDEIHQKVTLNETYCKLKLNTITKSAEEIQKVIGGEPR